MKGTTFLLLACVSCLCLMTPLAMERHSAPGAGATKCDICHVFEAVSGNGLRWHQSKCGKEKYKAEVIGWAVDSFGGRLVS
jgi:hypothetical protein